jgi:hypothetical protein
MTKPQPGSGAIENGVIEVLKNVSRRPIHPALDSDLVADLGFDSLQDQLGAIESALGVTPEASPVAEGTPEAAASPAADRSSDNAVQPDEVGTPTS